MSDPVASTVTFWSNRHGDELRILIVSGFREGEHTEHIDMVVGVHMTGHSGRTGDGDGDGSHTGEDFLGELA